ncbi:TPA: hypothetical protein ACGQS5_004782 [Serratia liquefaciens]
MMGLATACASATRPAAPPAAALPRQAWLVDACGCGREGLVALARAAGAETAAAVAQLSALPRLMHGQWGEGGLCVVRLPVDPAPLCHELRALLVLLPALPSSMQVVVLVPGGVRWVVLTLARALSGLLCPPVVGVFSSRLALSALAAVVRAGLQGHTLCGVLPGWVRAERRGLSVPELEALSAYLHGAPVTTLARRRAISVKTVYNQRRTALLKLGVRTPQAAWRLLAPAYRQRVQEKGLCWRAPSGGVQ